MSVGLPGTGIGALFYLLSALWAPMNAALRGNDPRRRGIGIAIIALIIVAVVAASTYAIHMLLPSQRLQLVDIAPGTESDSTFGPLFFLIMLSPLGTLGLILIAVRVVAAVAARTARGSLGATTLAADTQLIDSSLMTEHIEVHP